MITWLLWSLLTVWYSLFWICRFFYTILFGEDEARRRIQEGLTQFAMENSDSLGAAMRLFEPKYSVTYPDPPETAEGVPLEQPIVFAPAKRYGTLQPPPGCRFQVRDTFETEEPVKLLGFVIEGPGLPSGSVWVGPSPEVGASICTGLEMVFRAGQDDAALHKEEACTRP